jgi:hypothetical protein
MKTICVLYQQMLRYCKEGGLKCLVCVSAVGRHSSAFGGFFGD